MNHYYTNDPDLEHNETTFNFELGGHNLRFTTDNGVFSKHTVDYGTRVLIDTIIAQPELAAGGMLDVGCGWGPIGITMATNYPDRKIMMSDVNERAMELANRNAVANGVDQRVTIVTSSAYDNVDGQFGVVITNPPVRAGKSVVSAILEGAKAHLNQNGEIFVVLQKKQGAPSAKKLLEATFGNAEILKKDSGYYILHAVNTGDEA